MIGRPDVPVRLLPWTSLEGKPCYLLGGGSGYVSRIADDMERVQLKMAVELLGHATCMLDDDTTTLPQFRYLVARMAESLSDLHRVAESRGARIPALGDEDDEIDENNEIDDEEDL
ncbi:hypothetical protein AA958_14145 [Streptomyces sp. CNQ-509]|uniref:hypothetical protein n=1 Tax=Streptomyces sp. CNQ-509 TaxID=444103 RepID=UPI00062DE1EE|nr:hypothetical protein [Streptomyces sp. CNQ-509]AKH83183.1 hypothetical protein AA958_14145 [Streptomyces sp. CNQ-509]